MGLIMYGGTPYGGVRKSSSASSALDAFLDGSFATGDYVNDRITKVSPNAFAYTNITSVSLPNVTDVGEYAFRSCKSLTSVYIPNLSAISNSMFNSCASLTSISFPHITNVGYAAFYSCDSLTSVHLPNAEIIGNQCFLRCKALSSIRLDSLIQIEFYTFSECNNLSLIDLPKASSISGANIVRNTAPNLKLILRNISVCAINSSYVDVFQNSAFASTGSGGTLYVPQSLVSAYQNDTKWKQVMNLNSNNQILPIEGSPYENT